MHALFFLFFGVSVGLWVANKFIKMGQTVERGTIIVNRPFQPGRYEDNEEDLDAIHTPHRR